MERPANIVHTDEVDWYDKSHGKRYEWRRKCLGLEAGSRKLGCSLYELMPGKQSFPYHYHHGNEEAIYMLEGEGVLRLPSGNVPVKAGDYIALPIGEASAHQVLNMSGAPLRYLCVSTMSEPDISVYPDTGKVGFFAGAAPGGRNELRTLEGFVRLDACVDYWHGEE